MFNMPTAKELKQKYYTKKVTKGILKSLLAAGVIIVVGQSPYFAKAVMVYFKERGLSGLSFKNKRDFSVSFSYLKRNGFIKVEKKNKQIYISLTEKGKQKAKFFQLDELEIKKPKKWDGKWRLLLFDIPESARIKREALRGKLKELGFYRFQKSIWLHAWPCYDEISLLKDFFGFDDKDYFLIETNNLGKREGEVKKLFGLK